MVTRRCNFSLIPRYSLKFTRCSLLVAKNHSLLIGEVARCKIRSLLLGKVACFKKITCYSLQNLLITRCRSCSLQKITCYSLQKITRYSLQKITRYSLQNSLVTRCRSCSLQKITPYSLQKITRYSLKFARCSLQKWSHFSQLYEKVTPAQVFSCEFLRNFKNTYSVEHLQTGASENNIKRQPTFYSFLRQSSFSL